jgi:hypothetical protein
MRVQASRGFVAGQSPRYDVPQLDRLSEGRCSIPAAGGAEIVSLSQHALHDDPHFFQRNAVEHAPLPRASRHGVSGRFGFLIFGGKKEEAATFAGNHRSRGARKLFQCFLDIAVHKWFPCRSRSVNHAS